MTWALTRTERVEGLSVPHRSEPEPSVEGVSRRVPERTMTARSRLGSDLWHAHIVLRAAETGVVADLVPFWSAVVATVPVLALAAILEVRRSAETWSARARRRRVSDAGMFGVYTTLLIFSFFVAINALAYGGYEWAVSLVIPAMFGAIVLVSFVPVLALAVGGNLDVATILARYFPWSDWARQRRRLSRQRRVARSQMLIALRNVQRTEAIGEAVTARLSEACELERQSRNKAVAAARAELVAPDSVAARAEREHAQAELCEATMRLRRVSAEQAEVFELLEDVWDALVNTDHLLTRIRRVKLMMTPSHFSPRQIALIDDVLVRVRKL